MNTDQTMKAVVDAAEKIVDLVRDAKVLAAFDDDGNGPIRSLADPHLLFEKGPISKAADRLREALIDHERAVVFKETA